MDTSITPIQDIDTHTALEAAQSEHEALMAASSRAIDAARAALQAFEREPTPQAFAEHAVAEQRAKNALALEDVHERDVLAPLRQRVEAERIEATKQEMLKKLNHQSIRDIESAIVSAISALIETLESAPRDLQGRLYAHATAAREASALNIAVDGRQIGQVYDDISRRLAPLRRSREHVITLTGDARAVYLTITIPTGRN